MIIHAPSSYSTIAASVGLIIGLMFMRQKLVFDERNQLLITTLSEIEERERAEESLRKSEQEKAAILGGLKGVTVAYLDPQMRVIWINTPKPEASGPGLSEDEIRRGIALKSSTASMNPVRVAQPSKLFRWVNARRANWSLLMARPGCLAAAPLRMQMRISREWSM